MIVIKNEQSLIIKLGAGASGSPPDQCQYYVAYRETTDVSYEFDSESGFSNDTNNVSMVSVTALEPVLTRRVVDDISIYNPGTAVDVIVLFDNGTDEIILVKQPVAQFETLTYNDKNGWALN